MAIDKEKQYKRQNEWNKKAYDKITIDVPKGMKDIWKAEATEAGLSMAQWIIKKCQGD